VPFIDVPIPKRERRGKRIQRTYPSERRSETSSSRAVPGFCRTSRRRPARSASFSEIAKDSRKPYLLSARSSLGLLGRWLVVAGRLLRGPHRCSTRSRIASLRQVVALAHLQERDNSRRAGGAPPGRDANM